MATSELFLLFPLSGGATRQPSYVLKHSDEYEKFLSCVTYRLGDIIKLLSAEHYLGFYDIENVNAFLFPTDVGECYYPNQIRKFKRLLYAWGDNWREEAQQILNTKYTYYHQPIEDDTLCEMTERIINQDDDTSFLLVNCEAIKCKENTIDTARDGMRATIDVRNLEVKPIAKWFESNRHPERKFIPNPKHGENGRGAHPSNNGEQVSLLMCSKEEAHILLQSAIGTSYEFSKPLFFYDTQHRQYIEFRKTTSGDKVDEYHGFHLDAVASERRVPKEIKELIEKIL